jgi:hypothetical protein
MGAMLKEDKMAKNNNMLIFLGIALVIGALFYFKPFGTNIFAVTGTETMTWAAPSSVEKGSTFTLTHTAVGAVAPWGALLEETISGGCTFPSGGTTYRSGWFSDDGNTKAVTINAPATVGTCNISGNYKYGNASEKLFTTLNVGIVCTPSWSTPAWSTCNAAACTWVGKDNCLASYTSSGTQARTCVDANSCGVTTGKPAESQACSIPCTRTVTKNAVAPDSDKNCDGTISKPEAGDAIMLWVTSSTSPNKIIAGAAIQAWAGG